MNKSKIPPATHGRRNQVYRRRRGLSTRRSRGRDAARRSMADAAARRRDVVLRHRKSSHREPLQVVNNLPDKVAVTTRELDALESLFGDLLEF